MAERVQCTAGASVSTPAESLFDQHSAWAVKVAGFVAKSTRRGRLLPRQVEQAALVALWRCSNRFADGQGTFKGYAAAAIRGAVLDELRAVRFFGRRRDAIEPVSLSLRPGEREDLTSMLPDDSLPDVGADRRGLAELLDGAGLQDRYRRVLWLRYGDGLTLRQTAAALQVCAQRAAQIERAALQHLRERLERPRYAKGRSA